MPMMEMNCCVPAPKRETINEIMKDLLVSCDKAQVASFEIIQRFNPEAEISDEPPVNSLTDALCVARRKVIETCEMLAKIQEQLG